jgi:hypothetical protein
MNARQFLTLLSKHFAGRQRRVWVGEGRAHIELRSIDSHELLEVRSRSSDFRNCTGPKSTKGLVGRSSLSRRGA